MSAVLEAPRRLRKMTAEEEFLFNATGTLPRMEKPSGDMRPAAWIALEAKNAKCPASLWLSEVLELTAYRAGDFERAEEIATKRMTRLAEKRAAQPE